MPKSAVMHHLYVDHSQEKFGWTSRMLATGLSITPVHPVTQKISVFNTKYPLSAKPLVKKYSWWIRMGHSNAVIGG